MGQRPSGHVGQATSPRKASAASATPASGASTSAASANATPTDSPSALCSLPSPEEEDRAGALAARAPEDRLWREQERERSSFLRQMQARVRRSRGGEGGGHSTSRGRSAERERRGHPGVPESISDAQSDPSSYRTCQSYGKSSSSTDRGTPAEKRYGGSVERGRGRDDYGGGRVYSAALEDRPSSSGRGSRSGSRRSGTSRRRGGGPGELGHSGSLDMGIRDLEAKLRLAQRKSFEADERHRDEEDRAYRAEKQLRQHRGGLGAGSDQELQLMRKVVNLRHSCAELEDLRHEEDRKVQQIEDQLRREYAKQDDAQSSLHEAQSEVTNLTGRVKDLKALVRQLEEDAADRRNDERGIGKKVDIVAKELEETKELVDLAKVQKDGQVRDRRLDAERARLELERVRKEEMEEQAAVRRLLGSVDDLLGKLGRKDPKQKSEAARELRAIRDTMRTFIKKGESPLDMGNEQKRAPQDSKGDRGGPHDSKNDRRRSR